MEVRTRPMLGWGCAGFDLDVEEEGGGEEGGGSEKSDP
jgi:hypothetical protein